MVHSSKLFPHAVDRGRKLVQACEPVLSRLKDRLKISAGSYTIACTIVLFNITITHVLDTY